MQARLLAAFRWIRIASVFILVALAGSTASAAFGWWIAAASPIEPLAGKHEVDDKKSAAATASSDLVLPDKARIQLKEDTAAAISDHNLFCPSCVEEEAAAEQKTAKDTIEPTELPLRLVATMQADDPADSLATIQHLETKSLGVYEAGELITDEVKLVRVGRGAVLLAHATTTGGTVEMLGFPEKPKPGRKKKKKKTKKKRRKRSKYELKGARDSIDCKKGSCTVKRKFVQQLISNPAKLNRQAKFKTYNKNGKQGYKIYRVRRGTIGRLLGLRSGDLLTEVNGQPLDSLDRVMGLYTRLRRASHLTLTYERRGKTKELELNII